MSEEKTWFLKAIVPYGWTGQQSGSGFFDMPRLALGVFASLDRFWALQLME
jgi:hypothetical protein